MFTPESAEQFTQDMIKTMAKVREEIYDKAYGKLLEEVMVSKDYHHKTTNIHARVLVRMDNTTMCYLLTIQSNVKGEQPKPFCTRAITFQELMDSSIHEIMNTFFAKHVLQFILSGTSIEETTTKTLGVLHGYKQFNSN